jgi:glycosyltransferase involved in cell wall biosynthesis
LDIKVIHLPLNIGNNVFPLSLALRRRGIKSDCLVFASHPFGYPHDFTLSKSMGKGRLHFEVSRIVWLGRIIRNYNTIHFNFGSTLAGRVAPNDELGFFQKLLRIPYSIYLNLFQLIELNLYKMFKVRMFIHYQGDDARQGGPMSGLQYSLLQGTNAGYYSKSADKFKSKQIKRITKFTEKVYYLNPDLSAVLPPESEFKPYSHIDLSEYKVLPQSPRRDGLRIVHAPSNRGIKGTEFVVQALKRIRTTNPHISIEIIENLPHELALQKYQQANLVIDQMLGGWYGGLAVEAMALGVPVMCYLREEDLINLNQDMVREIPVINVTTETLEQKILQFSALSDTEYEKLRKQSRSYAEKWHDVDSICDDLITDYLHAHGTS